MIKYTVVLTKRAQKQLDKLPDSIADPIFEAIGSLEDNPSMPQKGIDKKQLNISQKS